LGAVLTLAGSWDAYRALVYNNVLVAPAEIMADLTRGAGLGGGDLVARLQVVDQGIQTLTRLGSGFLDVGSAQALPVAPGSENAPAPPAVSTPPSHVPDLIALPAARIAYLTSVIAVFGTLRLITGVLLALGPLFAGLLLFDATRGLFLAWARLLFGSLVGAVVVTAVLELELALLLPWLNNVLRLRLARVTTPAAPVELFIVVLAFAVVLFLGLLLTWRLALSAGLARTAATIARTDAGRQTVGINVSSNTGFTGASVADVALSIGDRSSFVSAASAVSARDAAGTVPTGSRVPDPPRSQEVQPVPLGQSYRRQIRALSGTARRRTGGP
jgi:type IV secretion system protein VirB6